ncbi:MAG: hypothetical protein ACOYKA_00770 [Legionellaceae bacterium]
MKYIDEQTKKTVSVDAATVFFLVKKNTDEFYIRAVQPSRSLFNLSFFADEYVLKIESTKVPLFRFTRGYDEIFPRDVLRQSALTKHEVKNYLQTDTTDFEDVEAKPHVIQAKDYLAYRPTIWANLPKVEARAKSQYDLPMYFRSKGI